MSDIDENFEDYDEMEEGDFGFIISANGKLKSIMFPEDLFDEPPSQVKRICKIFGIKNLNQLEPRTLH